MCIVNLISSSGGKLYEEVVVCFAVFTFVIAVMLAGAAFAAEKPYNIALIIKATDSNFWQYVIVGERIMDLSILMLPKSPRAGRRRKPILINKWRL